MGKRKPKSPIKFDESKMQESVDWTDDSGKPFSFEATIDFSGDFGSEFAEQFKPATLKAKQQFRDEDGNWIGTVFYDEITTTGPATVEEKEDAVVFNIPAVYSADKVRTRINRKLEKKSSVKN